MEPFNLFESMEFMTPAEKALCVVRAWRGKNDDEAWAPTKEDCNLMEYIEQTILLEWREFVRVKESNQ